MSNIHPASMMAAPDTAASAAAPSSSSRCPGLQSWDDRARSLPDLFLPSGGQPSRGFTDPTTRGKGAGVVLDAERDGASFKTQELMHMLYGGPEKLARRRELNAVVENDPAFRKWDHCFLGREERMRRAREKASAAVGHVRRLGLTDPMELSQFFAHIDDLLPTELHRSMFLPTILAQASEEQQALWLPLAQSYSILGTYVQTELGHGSFVRGMETTATFDQASDSFILNTPTLTSTKWWPGGLGKNTTHCCLMARLVTGGVDCGVHAFFLPLRDPSTYALLPGIVTGDIGPKVGYESMDNGFLRLEGVAIPRGNLFAKYARVTREGKYERVPGTHAKAAFGTMVFVRSWIVIFAARYLARALTISIRYSAVRRQFPDPGHPSEESPVLNYSTQQSQLFGLLATSFAFHFTGSFMRRLFDSNKANLAEGDTSLMAELHATSSGLKALTTTITSEGMETCRKCCGGHGYSRFCGISDIWVDYVPAQTYEGDNTVMFLQTARSLVKTLGGVAKGKVSFPRGSPNFYMHAAASLGMVGLSKQRSTLPVDPAALASGAGSPAIVQAQAEAFQHRVARLLLQASLDLSASAKVHPGWTYEQHWDACKVILVSAARAHCMWVLVDNFHRALASISAKSTAAASSSPSSGSPTKGGPPISIELQKVLRRLCDLFCWQGMQGSELGDFTVDGFVSLQQSEAVRHRVRELLAEIRPDAIALVDSFDFSDHFLNSALGRFDGDVYACMMEWAQRNPVNQHDVAPGIREFVLPLLQSGAAGKAKL